MGQTIEEFLKNSDAGKFVFKGVDRSELDKFKRLCVDTIYDYSKETLERLEYLESLINNRAIDFGLWLFESGYQPVSYLNGHWLKDDKDSPHNAKKTNELYSMFCKEND